MVSGTVKTTLFITKQLPGLYVAVEKFDRYIPADGRPTEWGADYDPRDKPANAPSYFPPNMDVGSSLRNGEIGIVSLWTTDAFWVPDSVGPSITLHMITSSRGVQVGPRNQVVPDTRFTLEIGTSKWPHIFGMPDTVTLTVQFEEGGAPFQFNFPNSNVSGARDIQIAIMLTQEQKVCVTAEAIVNGTLDFVDHLTGGVLVADAAMGVWAVGAVAGSASAIKLVTHAGQISPPGAQSGSAPPDFEDSMTYAISTLS